MESSISRALWRTLIVVLAAIACTQLAIELLGAPRQLTLGTRGEPLFEGRRVLERGPITFVVDALSPQSPLVAAGVRPGDRLRYDRPAQQFIHFAAGDRLSLTLIRSRQPISICLSLLMFCSRKAALRVRPDGCGSARRR